MDTLLVPALALPSTPRTARIAASLMAGVVIDTANFQHPNTTPRTLRVAAELRGRRCAALRHRARALSDQAQPPAAAVRPGARTTARRARWPAGLGDADRPDYLDAGAGPQDTEGLIDLLSQSATAEIVILFKQDGDRTRISVRTREGGVDATVL